MSNEEERLLLIEALHNPLRDLTMGQHGPGSADETVADALLPVVERIANRRAAEELWAAADEPWDDLPMQVSVEQLADRARIRAQLGRRAAVKRRAAEELLAASNQAMQGPPWIRGDHTTDRPGYNFETAAAKEGVER
jgi:hypothetical protein